jgi:hypothetical protein
MRIQVEGIKALQFAGVQVIKSDVRLAEPAAGDAEAPRSPKSAMVGFKLNGGPTGANAVDPSTKMALSFLQSVIGGGGAPRVPGTATGSSDRDSICMSSRSLESTRTHASKQQRPATARVFTR